MVYKYKSIGINSIGVDDHYAAILTCTHVRRESKDPNMVALYHGAAFIGHVWLDRIEPDSDLTALLVASDQEAASTPVATPVSNPDDEPHDEPDIPFLIIHLN